MDGAEPGPTSFCLSKVLLPLARPGRFYYSQLGSVMPQVKRRVWYQFLPVSAYVGFKTTAVLN